MVVGFRGYSYFCGVQGLVVYRYVCVYADLCIYRGDVFYDELEFCTGLGVGFLVYVLLLRFVYRFFWWVLIFFDSPCDRFGYLVLYYACACYTKGYRDYYRWQYGRLFCVFSRFLFLLFLVIVPGRPTSSLHGGHPRFYLHGHLFVFLMCSFVFVGSVDRCCLVSGLFFYRVTRFDLVFSFFRAVVCLVYTAIFVLVGSSYPRGFGQFFCARGILYLLVLAVGARGFLVLPFVFGFCGLVKFCVRVLLYQLPRRCLMIRERYVLR